MKSAYHKFVLGLFCLLPVLGVMYPLEALEYYYQQTERQTALYFESKVPITVKLLESSSYPNKIYIKIFRLSWVENKKIVGKWEIPPQSTVSKFSLFPSGENVVLGIELLNHTNYVFRSDNKSFQIILQDQPRGKRSAQKLYPAKKTEKSNPAEKTNDAPKETDQGKEAYSLNFFKQNYSTGELIKFGGIGLGLLYFLLAVVETIRVTPSPDKYPVVQQREGLNDAPPNFHKTPVESTVKTADYNNRYQGNTNANLKTIAAERLVSIQKQKNKKLTGLSQRNPAQTIGEQKTNKYWEENLLGELSLKDLGKLDPQQTRELAKKLQLGVGELELAVNLSAQLGASKPLYGAREDILQLREQNFTIDEIARKTNLRKGEVELLLYLANTTEGN